MSNQVNVEIGLNDIPTEAITAAYRNISHDPEKRAKSTQQEYYDAMTAFLAELYADAKTPTERAVVEAEFSRYKTNYKLLFLKYLLSLSKTASPGITGPANFPVAKNRKANDAAEKHLANFIKWRDAAKVAARKAVFEAKPDADKLEKEWEEFGAELRSSLDAVARIDGGEKGMSRNLFVVSITGRIERAAKNGKAEIVRRALNLIREYNASHEKPVVTDRSRVWKLAQASEAATAEKAEKTDRETEIIGTANGVTLFNCHREERVQFQFVQKPDKETVSKLKRNGWHWSPSVGMWQRRNTTNGVNNAKVLLSEFRAMAGDR